MSPSREEAIAALRTSATALISAVPERPDLLRAVETLIRAAEVILELPPEHQRLPDTRPRAVTRLIRVGAAKVYATLGEYEGGRLGEIFLRLDELQIDPTSEENATALSVTAARLLDAVAIAVSIGLQYGVPLATYVRKFKHTKFEPSGPTGDPELRLASSPLDAVFRFLGVRYAVDPPAETAELPSVAESVR